MEAGSRPGGGVWGGRPSPIGPSRDPSNPSNLSTSVASWRGSRRPLRKNFFCAEHRVGCAGPPPREKLVSKTLGRPGCLRLARRCRSTRLVAKELRSFFSDARVQSDDQAGERRARGCGTAPRRLCRCRRHLRSAQDGHVAPRDTRGARRCRTRAERAAAWVGAERRHSRLGLWVGRLVPSV